jgi:methionyl aminopeptidase
MRIQTKNKALTSELIKLKDSSWLTHQRIAGRVTADTLQLLKLRVQEGTTKNLLELNQEAEDFIYSKDCTPTFKGYKGFPAGVCMSVNKQLVHGIPTDYNLVDGDVVKFDLGATYNGVIADSALTCIYGEPKLPIHLTLLKATEEALMAGINSIQVGNRLGCIGYSINRVAKKYGFANVTHYGGHGINASSYGKGEPHAPPFVPNKSELDSGIRIQNGLTIAIEPMFILGSSASTQISDDKWTVMANEIGAHFEHTIIVNNNIVEILTKN